MSNKGFQGFDQKWLDQHNQAVPGGPVSPTPNFNPRAVKVRGTRGRSKEPNKTELAYMKVLDARKAAGEILQYWFESFKLRLADRTWFEIDFMVLTSEMEMQMHEVKTTWRKQEKFHVEDDAWVKLKVVADLYPFRFIVAAQKKGAFELTEI